MPPSWRAPGSTTCGSLVEPGDGDAPDQVREAESIERALADAGVTAPQLHHGRAPDLGGARRRPAPGHDMRVGLEDTLVLADGSAARDNAELVAALAGLALTAGRQAEHGVTQLSGSATAPSSPGR